MSHGIFEFSYGQVGSDLSPQDKHIFKGDNTREVKPARGDLDTQLDMQLKHCDG